MDDKGITKLLEQVASDNDADLYLFSGPVAIKAEREFNQTLADNKQRKNALCLTTTYGGSADVAYQIVRAVRRCYPEGEFILFVDSICKSAGTLIALGADSIIMSDTAELGPLDVQVQRPGEMGEFISGLTPKQALATLRESAFEAFEFYFLNLRYRSHGQIATRMAAEMAVEIVNGSYRPIYEQFDPMRLGENERSVAIARSYGQRIQTDNVKDDTIEELVNGYPSHGFVIDRDEAAQLFVNVRKPSPPELAMAKIFRSLSEQTLFADAPIIRCLEFGGNTHDKSEKEDEDNDQLDSEEDFPTCDEQTKSEQHADNTDEAGASVPPEEAGRSRD